MFVGLDANATALVDVSRRALAKPARGGAENAMFGVMKLEDAPGDLTAFVDELTVLLPWGTLLRAVACADVHSLLAMLKPNARARFVFGYGAADGVGLPSSSAPDVDARYRAAGVNARVREIGVDDVRALGTTWANKLAFSGHARSFVEVLI